MYNTQNNALAEQEKFMLPAAMPEGEFTQEELAEDMDGLQMSFPRIKIPGGGALMFEIPSDDPENPEPNWFKAQAAQEPPGSPIPCFPSTEEHRGLELSSYSLPSGQ